MLPVPLFESVRRVRQKKVASNLIRWGRRRANWWVALLLPGLLLRALIPIGFMPMFGPDFSVRLALCEGYAPIPSMPADMSMDMSEPMSMGAHALHHSGGAPDADGNGPRSHQDHGTCPYAASPTLASLVALIDVPASVQPSAPCLISAPQVAHFEISPRAQSPRGPPLDV
jgi:hypothetical protein